MLPSDGVFRIDKQEKPQLNLNLDSHDRPQKHEIAQHLFHAFAGCPVSVYCKEEAEATLATSR